jgi:hypothetical protein
MLSVVNLSVTVLSVIMLSGIRLSVVVLLPSKVVLKKIVNNFEKKSFDENEKSLRDNQSAGLNYKTFDGRNSFRTTIS